MASPLARVQKRAFSALNEVVEPLVRAGIGSPLPWGGVGLVILESTGHRSKKTRSVPLVGVRVGERVVTSTVRTSSHWVTNVDTDPQAGVWLNGRRRSATASVKRGPLTVATFELDAA